MSAEPPAPGIACSPSQRTEWRRLLEAAPPLYVTPGPPQTGRRGGGGRGAQTQSGAGRNALTPESRPTKRSRLEKAAAAPLLPSEQTMAWPEFAAEYPEAYGQAAGRSARHVLGACGGARGSVQLDGLPDAPGDAAAPSRGIPPADCVKAGGRQRQASGACAGAAPQRRDAVLRTQFTAGGAVAG